MKKYAKRIADPEGKGWRTLPILFTSFFVMSCLIGCGHFFGSYMEIPRPAAVNALMTTRDWGTQIIAGYSRADLVDDGIAGLEYGGWGPIETWSPAKMNAAKPGEFLEILHLSDAQIRDTHILRRSDYRLNDFIFKDTLRLELIENLDSLLLAAILRGYRKAIASYDSDHLSSVLAVHTGDLLDISLVTEMIDAAGAVNHACKGPAQNQKGELKPLPFLSVPGNHDGLTFGNLKDQDTITWELGLNRLEFHLASLELLKDFWPDKCVAMNEVLSELANGKVNSLRGAPVFSKRVKELFANSDWKDGKGVLRYTPVALKGRVNIDRTEDGAIQPGYFSLVRNGFRIIGLDTTSKQMQQGSISLAQLGWLYRELRASLTDHQPALIFAHHHPSDFKWFGEGKTLKKMICSFPHVLGYFYGHKHEFKAKEENNIWFVQAPSLVDFPLGALLLRVERKKDAGEYLLTVNHVKAGPDRTKGAGMVLDALQDEALNYAWYDAGAAKDKEPQYSVRTFTKKIFSKSINWASPCPTPQEALGRSDLIESISEERGRLINEQRGSWYDIVPSPEPASRSNES